MTVVTGDALSGNSTTGAVRIATGSATAEGGGKDGSGPIDLRTGDATGGSAAGGISLTGGLAKARLRTDAWALRRGTRTPR